MAEQITKSVYIREKNNSSVEKEVINIPYVCEHCGKRRILRADKGLLEREIHSPTGNGLSEIVDLHTCKENRMAFHSLSIDGAFRVRSQTLLEFKTMPQTSHEVNGLSIPVPQLAELEHPSLRHAKVPDFFFKGEAGDYFFEYMDEQTGVKIELNTDNLPAEERKIVSHDGTITISYAKGDVQFENWVDQLMAVNELIHPNDAKAVLFQLLYIQERLSKFDIPTALDNEALIVISMLKTARAKPGPNSSTQDLLLKGIGSMVIEDHELAMNIAEEVHQKEKKLTELLSKLSEKISVSALFSVLVALSHLGIIELELS